MAEMYWLLVGQVHEAIGIGSSYIKAILKFNIAKLVVVDINENGLTELVRYLRSSTDVQIKIFDNSISFFNPTGLYGNITEDDLKTDTYRASTRNKKIAEAF
jgi:predicted HTH transcriptional regulator